MDVPILTVSERGQITIPITVRKQFDTDLYQVQIQEHGIFLKPLEIEEYEDGVIVMPALRKELDEAWGDYQQNGGHDFEAVVNASHKKS